MIFKSGFKNIYQCGDVNVGILLQKNAQNVLMQFLLKFIFDCDRRSWGIMFHILAPIREK